MLHLTVFHLFSAGLSFSVGLSYVFHIFWGPSALRRFTSLSFVYFLRVFHEFSIFSGGLHRFSVSFVYFLRALYSLPFIHFARWLSYILCGHLSLFLRCCHLYQILRLSLELGRSEFWAVLRVQRCRDCPAKEHKHQIESPHDEIERNK
mmetsp:Transcript_15325/g.24449  ORF Transcript_15325/g.24449 Transcript_15325/m.24449 type:complete len:149 (-) Transcript_15325:169-615(-)